MVFLQHCAKCHGADGHGDPEAIARQKPPPRDFVARPWRFAVTLDSIRQITADGIPATAMPAHRSALSADDLEAVPPITLLHFNHGTNRRATHRSPLRNRECQCRLLRRIPAANRSRSSPLRLHRQQTFPGRRTWSPCDRPFLGHHLRALSGEHAQARKAGRAVAKARRYGSQCLCRRRKRSNRTRINRPCRPRFAAPGWTTPASPTPSSRSRPSPPSGSSTAPAISSARPRHERLAVLRDGELDLCSHLRISRNSLTKFSQVPAGFSNFFLSHRPHRVPHGLQDLPVDEPKAENEHNCRG